MNFIMKSKHFQKVSVLFDEILPVNLKQKAFIYNNIFNNWKQIVGEDISDITIPSSLKFKKNKLFEATLIIKVHEMCFSEGELMIKKIIQRINFFFGSNVVKKIILKKPSWEVLKTIKIHKYLIFLISLIRMLLFYIFIN